MRVFYFIICFFVVTNTLVCQALHFEHTGDKIEFLGSTILDIIQDQQGFIWIATTDGLGKYDGKTVVEYRHIRGDSTSLSNNYITNLYEDQQGRIWAGTKSGLNCYLPHSDSFVQYYNHDNKEFEAKNYILDVLEDQFGFIWYSTYGGLYRLDLTSGHLMHITADLENKNSFSGDLTYNLFEDSKGRLWLATINGVAFYKNDNTFQFTQISAHTKNELDLKLGRVFNFTEQENGTLWAGTNQGVYKIYETKDGISFQQFKHEPDNDNSLSHDFIQNLHVEGNEKLWVSTWAGGLNEVLLPKDSSSNIQFIRHRADKNDSRTISLDQVNVAIKDESGILWVGSSSGLDKVVSTASKFSEITSIPNQVTSLSNQIIKSIVKDPQGNLWIGTYDGLNFLSAENLANKHFEFEIFKHDKSDPNSISHSNIFGLEVDSLGFLWIGTHQGLQYVNLNTFSENPVFYKIKFKNGVPHTRVYNILEIEKGKYWIATYGKLAIMTFNPLENKEPEFEIFDMDPSRDDALVNATTYQVCKDKYGEYWIATFLGLSKYVKKNGQSYFENYKNSIGDTTSLSGNSVIGIFLDSKKRLWIMTRNGLNLVIQNSENERASFRSFGSSQGFPNAVIQSVLEDADGLFWIGTNRGLIHFDPNAAIANRPSVIKTYTQENGLLSKGLVFRASYKDKQGNLFFGTAGGVNYLNPDQINDNIHLPPIVFTQLKILNKDVKPSNDQDAILTKAIQFTDSLTLKYNQNDIELAFAALDFANPLKNQYQFILEGYNKNWILNGNNNTAIYTNLPPGHFIFKVKGSNNDGHWNEEPALLFIQILPPWWKSWWAYFFYAVALTSIIYGYMNWRIQRRIDKLEEQARLLAARNEERALLRKKNAADFHDELGHRLTKISLFLELADRETNENTSLNTFLSKIKSNTIGLSEGIRDLIWSLDPEKDSLFQTLNRLQEFGDRLFDFSNILFKTGGIDLSFEQIELEPNTRKHILMIFKEAMNNTLKYSSAEKAMLQSVSKDGHITIIFKDDGKGFDLFQNKKGYGLKNMKERAEKINGKMEIITEFGEGTKIVLIIQIPQMG